MEIGVTWGNLKNFRNSFSYSNKIFKLRKIQNLPTSQELIHETNLVALGSLKWLNSCFYALNNICSYTQVVIAFVLKEDFDISLGPFFAFCLFLLQKNFDVFHMLLSPVFLCVFDDIYLPFLCILRKFWGKIFLISFIRILFARIFFIRVFSLEFSLSEFSDQNQKKLLYRW